MEKKLSKKLLFFWPSRTLSYAVGSALFSYVTLYATNFLDINALTAGMLFMVSKIFDGVTDIIAGYLIDKTHTRFGKARPYELSLIGYWACMVLMFSSPKMGMTASCVYLFVTYTLINSVFLTLMNCSEPVYLANALENPKHSVTVVSVSGFVSLIFTMIASIILPLYIDGFTTLDQWRFMSVVIAVPCTVIGLLRFFTVKEIRETDAKAAQEFRIRDALHLLIQNKYILIFSIIILTSNMGSNLVTSVTSYYALYIIGDLSAASLLSLAMLGIIITIIVTPVLSKKLGFENVMRVTTAIGMAGYLLRLIAPTNLLLVFISQLFGMLGFYSVFAFVNTFVIDCMDYGEWKTGQRSEGTIACAQSVTSKIGTALGVGVLGLLLGVVGFDGTLDIQSSSANMMITLLSSVIPAAFCLIQLILLKIYDLDKYLPRIRKDLEAQKETH